MAKCPNCDPKSVMAMQQPQCKDRGEVSLFRAWKFELLAECPVREQGLPAVERKLMKGE